MEDNLTNSIKEKNKEIENISTQNILLQDKISELTGDQIKLLELSNEQIKKVNEQTKYATPPVLRIEPDFIDVINKEKIKKIHKYVPDNYSGKFELSMNNYGINDIVEIELFSDAYYINLIQKELEIKGIGKVKSTKPIIKVDFIESDSKEKLILDISEEYKEFAQIKDTSKYSKNLMMIIRLQTNFKRKIDKKRYEYVRAYIIMNNGTSLTTVNDLRNIQIEQFSFSEFNRRLGVTEY